MISFDRNNAAVTITAAFIRSAATGAITTQAETTKPAAGGLFKFQSIDLLAISGTPTVSIQAYVNGVAVGSPVTGAINTTTKTTFNLSANTNFYNINEIGITGFNADGVRADNLISTTAVVSTGPPSFSYASPQSYKVGALITPLGPTNTGGVVSAFSAFATFASVNTPGGVAVDANGNVNVTDTHDDQVYVFTSGGVNIPGSPFPGNAGDHPYGAVIDGIGNAYIANGTAGTVSLVNTALQTFVDIKGFTDPVGLAVDASNNCYVTDLGNLAAGSGVVYKILAGTTTATPIITGLNNPSGIAVNSNGDIFIAQYTLNTIIKAASGTLTRSAFVSAGLNAPYGMVFGPLGGLYVADAGSNTIKIISTTGVVSTVNGTGLSYPYDVAFDGSGNMYIANNGGNNALKSVGSGYTISPALPAGLKFSNYSGAISGTPTVISTATVYTITGTNAQGSSTATVSIATTAPVAPVIAYSGPQVYTTGTAITPLAPTNTGGAVPVTAYGTVSTFAGSGTIGSANGTGAAASFSNPVGVTVDASGNIYVADLFNNMIRKITPAGVVSTLAGSATAGSANGTGAAASFNDPAGVAVDASGNVYVADYVNNLIRKVTAAGVVTTLAGSGTAGSANGTGAAASFSNPTGAAVDASGNVYVADPRSNEIREITPAGVVTTLAGSTTAGSANGTGGAASFNFPFSTTVDASGNAYVADATNNEIRKITPAGVVTTLAGSTTSGSANGTGAAASFNAPYGAAVDVSGNVYVADKTNNLIRMVTPAGVVTTIAGTGAAGFVNGLPAVASFNGPQGLSIDPTSGNLFAGDAGNNAIREIIGTGYSISPALPAGLSFNSATGLISGTPSAVSAITAYTITAFNVAGSSVATVNITVNQATPVLVYATPQVYASGAAIPPLVPTNTGGATGSYAAVTSFATVTGSNGLCFSAATGYIYATSTPNSAGYIYNTAGTLIYTQTTAATGYNNPVEIVADASGSSYVANSGAGTVVKLTTSAVLTTISGFTKPTGIAIDAAGNVYVADNSTNNIYKIAAGTSTVTTLLTGFASAWGVAVNSNGDIFVSQLGNSIIKVANGANGGTTKTIFATGFNSPRGLTVGAAGNIYVADCYNNAVKVITPNGTVSTLIASGLNYPTGVGFDMAGNMYISNYQSNSILTSAPSGYAVTSGTLPAGLILNAYNGVISGTPTTPAAAVNVTVTATNSTGNSSAVINITIGATIAWTAGSSTTAWATGGNWSTGAVPGVNDAVSIGVSAYTNPFEPLISAANVSVNSVTFGAVHAAVLTIGTGETLTISSSLTVNANAAPTLTGTGTGAVNIAPLAILNITGSGVLTLTSPLIFTLKSTAAGSASVGQITAASITGTGADSIKVERYITGGAGYRGYRLLSSPVYAATVSSNNVYSINYLHDHVFLTGTSGTANGFDKAGNPTLYLFREDQTPLNASFTDGNFWGISNIAPNSHATVNYSVTGGNPATTGSFNIPVGNGLMFFFRGDRTTVNPYTVVTVPVATTVTATGTLNTGQVIVHNWYTPTQANLGWTNTAANAIIRGFNLVGNPYASSIDWEQFNINTITSGIYASNVSNTVYQLNPATNNFDVYQVGGINTNHGTRTIMSGQGFFVLAGSNSSPQLIFNESAKTSLQNTGLNLFMATKRDMAGLNASGANPHLRLQMALDSVNTDDIYIGFPSNASAQFVNDEDAPYKKGSGKVQLASFSSDSVMLAINKLPLPNLKQTTIPLFVTAAAYGTFKLNLTELEAIPQLYEIWLMDCFNKDSLDMRHNPTYAFEITADTNSYGNNRFQLVIRQNLALELHLLNFTATKAANGAQTTWKTENEQNYTNFTVERSTNNGLIFNVLGGFVSSALGVYSYLDTSPPVGTDLYRLKMEDLNGAISYSKVVTLMYANTINTIAGNITVYPNPASSVINLSINQNNNSLLPGLFVLQTLSPTLVLISPQTTVTQPLYGIKIISITGSIITTAISSQSTWQNNISKLTPGTYIIQVINNNDNTLVGKSTFIKL